MVVLRIMCAACVVLRVLQCGVLHMLHVNCMCVVALHQVYEFGVSLVLCVVCGRVDEQNGGHTMIVGWCGRQRTQCDSPSLSLSCHHSCYCYITR